MDREEQEENEMKTISLKAEQVIKGLIDGNIQNHESTDSTSTWFVLKYENQEFDITLSSKTDRQVVIHYFYSKIMELEMQNES
jgi:hypothetical protein